MSDLSSSRGFDCQDAPEAFCLRMARLEAPKLSTSARRETDFGLRGHVSKDTHLFTSKQGIQ